MNKILALIRTEDLNIDEAIVASSKATIHIKNKMWHLWGTKSGITKEKTEMLNWIGEYDSTPFQTSKSLTDLKKQFEDKGYVVYLHEKERIEDDGKSKCIWKEDDYDCIAKCMRKYPNNCSKCKIYKEDMKRMKILKPLTLAVFAEEKIVEELI